MLPLRSYSCGLVLIGFLCFGPSGALAADLVDVVKAVENSVVRVDSDNCTGSGAIVGEGLIITNYHVIDGARQIEFVLRNGTKVPCPGYLAVDPTSDLAVLRAPKLNGGTVLKIAPNLPSIGERVAAFGNPKGFSFSTSEGIISSIRKGSEVRQTVGKEAYQILGYSENCTWVQTTAPISHGNSGGPLVNMNSELVGLNTWSWTGQQLNFAISLVNVKQILDRVKPDTKPLSFDSLPRVRSKPLTGDWYEPLKPYRLELPTGRIFSFDVFRTSKGDGKKLSASSHSEDSVVVFTHPNGVMYAAAQHANGVLHGLTVAQYDNEEPMVHVSYHQGRRHGLLKTWDEAGEPVFFCQYYQGRRHGFACLFEEGVPALIVQYEAGREKYVQLMSSLTALEGFDSVVKARGHARANARLTRIDELDAEMKRNEAKFRRQIKEYELDIRRELAAKQGPEVRARMRERNAARVEANNKFFSDLERKARGY
jgi:hypothetical protein